MPSLRSERVYLAHGQPRPSSHVAAPSLRYGPPDSPPFCKSSFASIECPRFARSTFTSRTVTRGRQPAGAGPLLRAGPLGDCRGRPCGKCPCGPAGRLARNLLQPSVIPARRSVVAEKPWNHHVDVPRPQPQGSPDSPGGPDTVRVETDSIAQHRTGNAEQAVGHRAQGARVSVAAGT